MKVAALVLPMLAFMLGVANAQAVERTEALRLLGVYDAVSGEWITRATVRDTLGVETYTNRAGIATLNVLTPIAGFYLLEIRKEGYLPRAIRIRVDSFADMMIALAPNPLGAATQLPAVVTIDRRTANQDPGLREGFVTRCQMHGVDCIGPRDLDRRPVGYLASLLGNTPGIHRECIAASHGVVVTPGKQPELEPEELNGCLIQMRPTTGVGYCTPVYFVDGFEWQPMRGRAQAQIDAFLPPKHIAGIEVYQANQPHPGRFYTGPFNNCGMIVIWTR